MSWVYEQGTGELYDAEGELVATGYAGRGGAKNNPVMQTAHGLGPLPRGTYLIEAPIDTKTHGDFVLWLTPDAENQMFRRSGFGIHGDSKSQPGEASQGCIVLPRSVRERVWDSDDHDLQVVR